MLEPLTRFLINEVCKNQILAWTLHPRTRKMLESFSLYRELLQVPHLILLEPLGYLEMLRLNMSAKVMLSDSGGLQEECTILGTPCLTLRWNTERPVTLIENGGVNVWLGIVIDQFREEYAKALNKPRIPKRPELWDGHTAERCLKAILEYER